MKNVGDEGQTGVEGRVVLGVGEVEEGALLDEKGDDAGRSLLEHGHGEDGPGLGHLLSPLDLLVDAGVTGSLLLHLARRHHEVDVGPVFCARNERLRVSAMALKLALEWNGMWR